MNHRALLLLALLLCASACVPAQNAEPVHEANAIKIGEVSSTSAIIWTRLTKHPERNVNGTPFPKNVNDEEKSLPVEDLSKMEGSVPGAAGDVRVGYAPARGADKKRWTTWVSVDVEKDFTHQITLKELSPGTRYSLVVEGRPRGRKDATATIKGAFKSAPAAETDSRVSFVVVTGQDYHNRDNMKMGHQVFHQMKKLNPDFFVHTGDIVYYDRPGPYADTVPLARFKWNRIYSLPNQRAFHNRTASYFMKDDHDTLKGDCWPGQTYGDLTFKRGQALFREQVPMGEKTYRTRRWGKDLQIWLVEGRDFRSSNEMEPGPEKTIWGKAQKEWFFKSVQKSDATFRVLISPTPVVGPDRPKKRGRRTKMDNHANPAFQHEGDELRAFISRQKNMFVICGDRHWQYVTVDPVTGLKEASCGPTADAHARGFLKSERSSMHRFLRIKGGFLSVVVDRVDGSPQVALRHHGVDGKVHHEEIIKCKP